MHAALITSQETVELVEFPNPTPAPAGVVVDIAFSGSAEPTFTPTNPGARTIRRSVATNGRALFRRSVLT